MSQEETFEKTRAFLAEAGFNIFSKVRASDYDNIAAPERASRALLPEAKSIVLVGFGGNSFWNAFKSFLAANPEFVSADENVIDSYTILKLRRVSEIFNEAGDINHAAAYPFGARALDIDFLKLGRLGGIGAPSILGLLINPVYGTWISLRAAVITDYEFPEYDSQLDDFDPCPSCSKPCIPACPAHTVSEAGWDWESCMKWRLSTDVCSDKCASRIACPWGRDVRYSDDQIAHHHGFVLKSARKYFERPAE